MADTEAAATRLERVRQWVALGLAAALLGQAIRRIGHGAPVDGFVLAAAMICELRFFWRPIGERDLRAGWLGVGLLTAWMVLTWGLGL